MCVNLPQCNLRTCRQYMDGNCTNAIRYSQCEYAELNRIRIIEECREHSEEEKALAHRCLDKIESYLEGQKELLDPKEYETRYYELQLLLSFIRQYDLG